MWVGSRRGKSWRVVASRGESWRIVVARWIVRDRGESRGGSWRNVGAEIMGDRRGSWGTADCVWGGLVAAGTGRVCAMRTTRAPQRLHRSVQTSHPRQERLITIAFLDLLRAAGGAKAAPGWHLEAAATVHRAELSSGCARCCLGHDAQMWLRERLLCRVRALAGIELPAPAANQAVGQRRRRMRSWQLEEALHRRKVHRV